MAEQLLGEKPAQTSDGDGGGGGGGSGGGNGGGASSSSSQNLRTPVHPGVGTPAAAAMAHLFGGGMSVIHPARAALSIVRARLPGVPTNGWPGWGYDWVMY